MRFPSPLFLQQGVAKGGAILENDGEVTLPPIIQPIALISSPLRSNVSSTGVQRNSFFRQIELNAAGAASSLTASFPSLDSGVWDLNIIFTGAFTGTTDVAAQSGLLLQDPATITSSMFEMVHINGNTVSLVLSTTVSFADPGWVFIVSRVATVALDAVHISVSLLAKKIM